MKKKIGQLIKEKVDASNLEVTAFAKAINKERSNVYDIFKRDSIDTKLLKKIGHVLDYDFFQDLLEESTIEKIRVEENVKKSRVLIEVELREDEILNFGFSERVFRILNKQ
jgi:hypothetical protein